MTRRTVAQYNWEALEFDEQILGLHYTEGRSMNIGFVVVHHMTVQGYGNGSALTACYNIWQEREASAHYGVDGATVGQFVWDANTAWATGNGVGNSAGISIEHANSAVGDASGWPIGDLTWKTGAKLAAYIHKLYKLGRPTSNGNGSAGTLRVHQSFYSTGCPGPWMMAHWSSYVAEAQRVYDQIIRGAAPTAAPAPAPAPKPAAKTISQLADEVIAGKYGSGAQRQAALGSQYAAVQAEVNRKLSGQAAPRLSNTTIAFQVIAGQWGNGDDRVNRLRAAGYDPNAVQAEVNRLL